MILSLMLLLLLFEFSFSLYSCCYIINILKKMIGKHKAKCDERKIIVIIVLAIALHSFIHQNKKGKSNKKN